MKGILYEGFLLNRKWFLTAGIIAALGTLVCAIMIVNPNKTVESISLAGTILIVTLVLSIVVCGEWLDRNLEKDLKRRFVDVALAGGISKNMYVMTLMAESLISMAISFAMCMAVNGIVAVVDKAVGGNISFWSVFYIKLAAVVILLTGVVNFIACPLTIKFKSAEKAGLAMGLFLAFVVVLPLSWYASVVSQEANILQLIGKFINAPYFIPLIAGASAVIYAIVYMVLLKRVKRGDVC